ncbi:structure-specific endonuclease subunit SLX4 [Trichomycterus rosablanca]|uniref:structure-specific endonuclease subunit SLX4 n=1 Tax=Trichomycterus rosablanca TaxID=2290929 RepID=UPI002F352CBB
MDDSDQDFSILCSRLLKRVKRKGESGDEKKPALKDEDKKDEGSQVQSRSKLTCKKKREKKEAVKEKEKIRTDEVLNEGSEEAVVEGNKPQEKKVRAKDKVLSRMQRFKRADPPRLQHTEKEKPTENADSVAETPASLPNQEPPEKAESDDVVAQRLQKQSDSKAETHAVVDVEDGGLFFCQLCYKDLSAMNHQLRTQHINRCLDKTENSSSGDPPPRPPPRPRVPECPICGRGFKSEKTRSAHLKRCSAAMGVSPAELLRVLHRQAAETRSNSADEPRRPTGGSSDTSDSSMPKRKKARKRAPRMDEDTMVAMALSRSLLQQEIERERDREEERQIQCLLSSSPTKMASALVQKKSAPGKGRGKRRKLLAGPPPLLLIQDPQTAQIRIQERVSALLLCPRPPTPPTPTLPPSSLPTRPDSAILWIKSALPGGGPATVCEFYTTELRTFIQPGVKSEKHQSLCSEVTPVKQHPAAASKATTDPEQRLTDRPATRNLGMPGTQALQDLVDLAEEGMTLTQSRCTDKDPAVAEPHLSGFVREPADNKHQIPSVTVSRLCSDLGSMVNNPQLSDVQLQVDTGEVYYAHSFMLYTRCPLLANMVHDEGFGVQEEGFRQAQRLLLNDVSGEAVHALLQYLYTASCPLTHALLPHVIQLATRFGLSELQQQCEQHLENSDNPNEDTQDSCPDQELEAGPQQSLADTQFMDLLRSMWEHEENDAEETGEAGGQTKGDDEAGRGDHEIKEEVVDEEELDEIYEFAATQRKKGNDDEADNETNEEEEDENREDSDDVKASTSPPGQTINCQPDAKADTDLGLRRNPDASLDRSYSRLFSESWGEYMEPTQTQHRAQYKNTPAARRSSTVSEVIDLSISPPPGSEEPDQLFLPVAGVSPGEKEDPSDPNDVSNDPKQTSGFTRACSRSPVPRGTHVETSTSVPSSSKPAGSHSNRSHPELIVLSDCSDDMDVDPPARPNQSYTRVKDRPEVRSSQTSTHPEPSGMGGADECGFNTSAEVSWLIPATPEPSARANSWQTGSSMRRTQLFPKSCPSSSVSSASSSKTAHRPSNVELHLSSESSVDDASKPPSGSISRSSQTSQSSFTKQTLRNTGHEPCSSTPVHSNPLLKKLDALESPLLKEDGLRTQKFGELVSLQLSPFQKACRRTSTSFPSPNADEMKTEEPPGTEDLPNTVIEEEAGTSFCAFDEPPIAFDDSWGLGGALPEQPPCFSLKLDSSEDPASPAEGPAERPSEHRGRSETQDRSASHNHSLPNADNWDSWNGEDEDEVAPAPPLSERLGPAPLAKRVAQLKTPVACKKKNQASLVPITPMPGFSDMDTPELKNRLNRFGVRPLPKKQMVLKLKEIHQYTHQLMSSGSEEETSPKARPKSALPQPSLPCFKQPAAPPPVSPRKLLFNEEEQDGLPASQDSSTSSTAESERSNPELCDSDSGGSDTEGVTASQAAVREKDKLQAVRSFIASDPLLYRQVLQYQPLSLSDLKARLRAAGIRLGTAKLLDFLDSQCITFTTAKPGQAGPSRRKARTAGRGRKRTTKAAV